MLRQGLAREHVGLVVAICALSDVVLIIAGVAGIGTIVEQRALGDRRGALARRRVPDLVRRELAAPRPQGRVAARRRPGRTGSRRRGVAVRALALTWLNPHVYLDTVLLLGSIANHEGPVGRWWFAAGACVASVLWFCGLGYGARRASRLLARPRAWQVLDVLIGAHHAGDRASPWRRGDASSLGCWT